MTQIGSLFVDVGVRFVRQTRNHDCAPAIGHGDIGLGVKMFSKFWMPSLRISCKSATQSTARSCSRSSGLSAGNQCCHSTFPLPPPTSACRRISRVLDLLDGFQLAEEVETQSVVCLILLVLQFAFGKNALHMCSVALGVKWLKAPITSGRASSTKRCSASSSAPSSSTALSSRMAVSKRGRHKRTQNFVRFLLIFAGALQPAAAVTSQRWFFVMFPYAHNLAN